MNRPAPQPPSQWGATFGLLALALLFALAVAGLTTALYIHASFPTLWTSLLGLLGASGIIVVVRTVASWLAGFLPNNFLNSFFTTLASDLASLWRLAIQPIVGLVALVLIVAAVILPFVVLPSFFDPYIHQSSQVTSIPFASWEQGGPCGVNNTGYQVNASSAIDSRGKVYPQFNSCFTDAYNFTNFIYEANMTITEGDCGGLLFRATEQQSRTYLFLVCQDSSYGLYYFASGHGPGTFTAPTCTTSDGTTSQCNLASSTAAIINRGLNRSNLLAVEADGNTFSLYVNQVLLTTVTDSQFTAGHIGAAADSRLGTTNVIFSSIKVWTL